MAGVVPKFSRFLAEMVRSPSFLLKSSRHFGGIVEDGFQDVTITVRGEYRPNVVRVVQGVPVRMRFLREEDTPCSARVIFSGIGIERRLAPFSETVIEFVPDKVGEHMFTCEMGMYRGRLIVVSGPS